MDRSIFLDRLEQSLANDDPNKQKLLEAARQLIPEASPFIHDDVDFKTLKKAVRQYQKFHPQYGRSAPTLSAVLEWLLGKAGITYATRLEQRITRLGQYLYGLGELPATPTVEVPTQVILAARMLIDQPMYGLAEEKDE
jgi:hypothetical protein